MAKEKTELILVSDDYQDPDESHGVIEYRRDTVFIPPEPCTEQEAFDKHFDAAVEEGKIGDGSYQLIRIVGRRTVSTETVRKVTRV